MFEMTFLPATIGDSIWIRYGDPADPHCLLVDGGTKGTRKYIQSELRKLSTEKRRFELMVVTHIDKDHIGGILTMIQRGEVAFETGDFWFNALRHMPEVDDDLLGVAQGEQLTAALEERPGQIPWNRAFGGKAVCVPDTGPLPRIELPGGMTLTLLSPTIEALATLRETWESEVRREGLPPDAELPDEEPSEDDDALLSADLPDVESLAQIDFEDDQSRANGSSIALLAEFEEKRVILAADAHVRPLLAALERVSPGSRVETNMFKISHHGSRTTTSNELIAKLDCHRFAFSTNGSIYRHPHHEAVARVLVEGGDDLELLFNYRSMANGIWDREDVKAAYGYRTVFPEAGKAGIVVEI